MKFHMSQAKGQQLVYNIGYFFVCLVETKTVMSSNINIFIKNIDFYYGLLMKNWRLSLQITQNLNFQAHGLAKTTGQLTVPI